MRSIKFRGKTEEMNSWWTYGNLVICDNGDYQIGNCPRYGDIYYRSKVFEETVGQYTGLHDENGKEVYEGDIIEFSYDMFVGNFDTFVAKGKVVFEEGAFYVEVFENERTTKDETYLLYSINLDTIEVIGNIYENKELLNETNR